MADPVDFKALRRVFAAPVKPGIDARDFLIYNGEKIPLCIARDLMQDWTEIMEHEGRKAEVRCRSGATNFGTR